MFEFNADFKDVNRMLNGIAKEIKRVKGVKVGYLSGEKHPNSDSTFEKIALSNEFGAPEHGLPPRAFIRTAFDKSTTWMLLFNDLLKTKSDFNQIVKLVGLQIRNNLIESIDSNIPPANAPETIKRKGSDKTLIDTGALRNAIHTQVY